MNALCEIVAFDEFEIEMNPTDTGGSHASFGIFYEIEKLTGTVRFLGLTTQWDEPVAHGSGERTLSPELLGFVGGVVAGLETEYETLQAEIDEEIARPGSPLFRSVRPTPIVRFPTRDRDFPDSIHWKSFFIGSRIGTNLRKGQHIEENTGRNKDKKTILGESKWYEAGYMWDVLRRQGKPSVYHQIALIMSLDEAVKKKPLVAVKYGARIEKFQGLIAEVKGLLINAPDDQSPDFEMEKILWRYKNLLGI